MPELRFRLPATLIVEHLSDGTVLYDSATDTVACLTGETTRVLAAAQDATVDEIAAATGLRAPIVAAHLGELCDAGLVVADSADAGLARRSLVRTAAGAAVTLGVWSLVAPTPAAASSGVLGY